MEKKAAKKKKSVKKKKKKASAKNKSGKSVVIVESPAKAKTINKILGKGFVVKACFGHVRDLPARAFGIDVENDFTPTYRTIKGKKEVIAELKSYTKKAPAVYLAPDPDREGEAIAWHLIHALKIPDEKAKRVTFSEITKRGVLKAFEAPSTVLMERVYAQQARRFLDRIVGYKLSPLLWKKIGRGLSAGRVQSVAVRLLVEREKEIKAFTAVEYWTVSAEFHKQDETPFKAELIRVDEKELDLKDGDTTNALVEELSKENFTVKSLQSKERVDHPPAPFTTSTLQQQASIRLHYSAKRTMRIAQMLYEGIKLGDEGEVGLITYMRTDSVRVANEAIEECRSYVEGKFGGDYLPEKPIERKSKKGSQEAHEAVRPTSALRTPEDLKQYLTDDQYKLYKLIWTRFVSSQMKSAIYLLTEAQIEAGRGIFSAKGRQLKYDGYTVLAGHKIKEDEQILPHFEEQEEVVLDKLDPIQHFTEPPPRYTEASLVRALEKFGIGRPSTYAPIISTIQDRGYVRLDARKLIPTELGILVTEKLVIHFDNILNTDFTANMEQSLDRIEEGNAEWVAVLKEFYGTFAGDLEKAAEEMEDVKSREPEERVVCEKCDSPMVEKWNKYGKFLACSKYPDCKNAKSLPSPETEGQTCDKCSSPMLMKSGPYGRFLACSKYPECKTTRTIQKTNQKVAIPSDFKEDCEKCGKALTIRYGRRGGFIACTGYPDCKNTRTFPKEWFEKAKASGDTTEKNSDTPPEDE